MVAVDYAYPWDRLITRFKFQGESGWAPMLADLLLRTPGFDALASDCDWVVPIPLSIERLAERGYNQAWELARVLCRSHRALHGKGLPQGLVRNGGRPDQHTLNRRQRLRNLQSAFALGAQLRDRLSDRRVLLIDDVTTTGATLHSAAQTLMQAGARHVRAAVIAHTP